MNQKAIYLLIIGQLGCNVDKSIAIINSSPDAYISSHTEGMSLQEGDIIEFRGSASDANHKPDQLLAMWYINGEVLSEGNPSSRV